MLVTYDPALTLREARQLYFAANHFGHNGGYDEAWVHVKLGPLPFPIPNTAGRVRAVKYHDLHHILTGYEASNIVGEFEISAWEIAAGCKNFYAAWVLNLAGIVGGLMIAPRRIGKAFARGLASRSLYGEPMDELLAGTVGQTRARYVGTGPQAEKLSLKGLALLTVSVLAGIAVGTAMLAVVVPLFPFGLMAKPS